MRHARLTSIFAVVLGAALITPCVCTFTPSNEPERWCFEAPGEPTTWSCESQTRAECVTTRSAYAGASSLAPCQRAEPHCYTYYIEGRLCYSTRAECLRNHGVALCDPAH